MVPVVSAASKRNVVVAVSSAVTTASRQFPGRTVYSLGTNRELSAVLDRVDDAATVTFVGRWSDLSVQVSRLLAEWAASDEQRGCGVVLVDGMAARKPRTAEQITEKVGILVNGGSSGIVDRSSFSPLDTNSAAELALSGIPPLAISVTGHGAEHCIRFGGSWLATDPRLPPGGPVVSPSEIRSHAVFLNCCSSLRLGDSAIPQSCSLSAALHRGGVAVVGSFRNIYTSPDAGLVFAEGLLAGLPMGRVVNAINRRASLWHETRAAFQLLGDPCRILSAGLGRSPEFAFGAHGFCLEPLARQVAQLDRLYETLSRWRPFPDHVRNAHEGFLTEVRLLLVAQRVAEISRIEPDEWDALERTITKAAERLQALVMEEVVAHLTDRWLDTLYSPLCRRLPVVEATCPRCGDRMTRYRYLPHREGLFAVDRDECDRCGTLAERVGTDQEVAGIDVEVHPAELRAHVGSLSPGAIGRVLVRHADGSAPQAWPVAGGDVTFPLTKIERRGRLTVAAVMICGGGLAVSYRTLFLPLG